MASSTLLIAAATIFSLVRQGGLQLLQAHLAIPVMVGQGKDSLDLLVREAGGPQADAQLSEADCRPCPCQ